MKRVYSALPMLRVVEYLTKPPTVDPAELDRITLTDGTSLRPARAGEAWQWETTDGRRWRGRRGRSSRAAGSR